MFLSLRTRLLVVAVILTRPFTACADRTDITGPAGSGRFGSQTVILPNGNIVVTDPGFDVSETAVDAGAVYLYSPSKVLISTLTGSDTGNQVGSGGIVVLGNGNYVVISPGWKRGTGAATWCSGVAGLSGEVSAANSLTGSANSDLIVSWKVFPLKNGNYVVCVPDWDRGAIADAGAVTWGDGAAGTRGVISEENSLTGSTPLDRLGGAGLKML